MGIWLATGLATIAYFVLGAAWFTPLFGRAWDRSIGHDRRVDGGRFPVSYYIVPLVACAVICAVIGALAVAGGITGILAGAVLGAGVGVAVAAASVTNALTPHTPQPYVFGAVTGGYHLVGCALAGALIGLLA